MARNKELSAETCQSILVLRNEEYSMREIAKKLNISYNAVNYSLHRTAPIGSNQIKLIEVNLSHAPNTTAVDLTVKCLLTGSNQ